MLKAVPDVESARETQENATVCFCYRKTLRDLRQTYAVEGNLARVQEATRVGTACGGCRAILHYHFGDAVAEINDFTARGAGATACVKPGNRVMKCFVTSCSLLESKVFSSNAVPPQLGDCNTAMDVEMTLYNQVGHPVLNRQQRLATGETFSFDTAREHLPKPFFGMIAYRLGRANYGASRLNVAWYNRDSVTTTHENSSTGRPDVVLPVPVDRKFREGPNNIYLAVQNPHERTSEVVFRVFSLEGGNIYGEENVADGDRWRGWSWRWRRSRKTAVEFRRTVQARGTLWIDASKELYAVAARELGEGTAALRIHLPGATIHEATSCYFFLHNRRTNVWSSNHL